jgi:hypothetical protein
MRKQLLILICLFVPYVWAADDILGKDYTPTKDLALIDKQQRSCFAKERSQSQSALDINFSVYVLRNRISSLVANLREHPDRYSRKQKAYKRLLIWYHQCQMRGLEATEAAIHELMAINLEDSDAPQMP